MNHLDTRNWNDTQTQTSRGGWVHLVVLESSALCDVPLVCLWPCLVSYVTWAENVLTFKMQMSLPGRHIFIINSLKILHLGTWILQQDSRLCKRWCVTLLVSSVSLTFHPFWMRVWVGLGWSWKNFRLLSYVADEGMHPCSLTEWNPFRH